MKSSGLEKDQNIENNIIKDVRNLCRLKKEINDMAIKDVKNLFRLKKENESIKDSIIRVIRNLFENENTVS